MFSGIIEEIQFIKSVEKTNNDIKIALCPSFKSECKVGQSISVQGICLTVYDIDQDIFFYLSSETLSKTNMNNWVVGNTINIERSLKLGDRIDGHLVQGHVDGLIQVKHINQIGEAFEVSFKLTDAIQKKYIYPKGSIAIDGISLTINEINDDVFKVMIIPHTWANTNAQNWQINQFAHVEFDSMAKMIEHQITLRNVH